MRRLSAFVLLVAISCLGGARPALAWGEDGHRIIALVAAHFLDPGVARSVGAILATDPDAAAGREIAGEADWADRAIAGARFRATGPWHFVSLFLDHPDLDRACGGHPALPKGTPASSGPGDACAVDKIEQFAAELKAPSTDPAERRLALKFLLNLVADLHQPLRMVQPSSAAPIRVVGSDFGPTSLQHFWEVDALSELGVEPEQMAADLVSGITQSKSADKIGQGGPRDWAMETFALGRTAYRTLPAPDAEGLRHLDAAYVTAAIETERTELARAGVRLAAILNQALGRGGR